MPSANQCQRPPQRRATVVYEDNDEEDVSAYQLRRILPESAPEGPPDRGLKKIHI